MGGITDTDYSAGPADRVRAMEAPSVWDVAERAAEVVNAAVRARQKEIMPGPSVGYNEDTGEQMMHYDDLATGTSYTYMGNNRWVNNNTGEDVDDPRNIDPAQYQWIIDDFKYFHERWDSYPMAMAMECEAAKAAIQEGEMSALLTADQIAWNGWGGDAQRHFTQFFLDPFVQTAVTTQQTVLDELAVAMYAYAALLKQARIDAKLLADKAIQALDGLHESNPPEATTVIKIAAAVVGVVGAIASGGGTLVVTLGIIGAGLGGAEVIAEGITEPEKSRPIEGSFVHEVLDKLRELLQEMKSDMDKVEENIGKQIEEAAGQVNGWLTSSDPEEVSTILPTEPDDDIPNVTDGEVQPGSDDFRPRT
ncbi:MAG TPA: hypothetical protein VIL37_02715 [Natronosporangium sp.]